MASDSGRRLLNTKMIVVIFGIEIVKRVKSEYPYNKICYANFADDAFP